MVYRLSPYCEIEADKVENPDMRDVVTLIPDAGNAHFFQEALG